jgi:hypothetical protein
MSDHGWKAMLARMSRWLASPVRVDFNPRARSGFGGRSISIAPLPVDEAAPPRRASIRFSAPVSQPAADRRRARETEYDQLQTEIERLARPDRQVPDR